MNLIPEHLRVAAVAVRSGSGSYVCSDVANFLTESPEFPASHHVFINHGLSDNTPHKLYWFAW